MDIQNKQRASNGFPRPLAFDKQTQSTPDLHLGTHQSLNDQRILEMNRTMSKLQFSRPSTAGTVRPSTAGADKPITRTSQSFDHTFDATRTASRPNTAGSTRSRLQESLNFGSTIGNQDRFDFTTRNPRCTSSATIQMVETVVPHYISSDKLVLRFFCHFFDKDTQMSREPIRKFVGPSTARLFVLHIYLEDNSFEIQEERVPNSGIQGGPFFKRGKLKRRNGTEFRLEDFNVGGVFTVLGHDFFITDCDEATREYYRREVGVNLARGVPRPKTADPEIGAQNATGLGGFHSRNGKKGHFGSRSQDYFDKKAQNEKTYRFHNYDNGCLRFTCVDVSGFENIDLNDITTKMKRYCMIYTLCDESVEIRIYKSFRVAADEPKLILKKGKLPKNWQDMPRGRPLVFYTPDDFEIGNIVDCFGRKMLIVSCDETTRRYYAEQGVDQRDIPLREPEEVKYEVEIPVLGDGYLAVGGEADTLHTVYGHPKPQKNWKKVQRNLGQIIRCKCKLLSGNAVNLSRNFMLTFHLEDDTIGVYEEVIKNSGVDGGNFLKRGNYDNGLPPDGEEPRPFVATDIYLGNIILLNGYEMQIVEMDDMSVRFCEENSDEFPFFDTFAIINNLMDKVLDLGIDIRETMMQKYDPNHNSWVTSEVFVKALDDFEISQEMNDQELMTLMRRFKEVLTGNFVQRKNAVEKYYYHEMCDLFSHAHCLKIGGSDRKNSSSELDRLLEEMRSRVTQWRRLARLDFHEKNGFITAAHLFALVAKSGLRLSKSSRNLIVSNYALMESDAAPLRPHLNKLHDMDRMASAGDISLASVSVKSVRSVNRSLRQQGNASSVSANTDVNRRRSVAKSILRSSKEEEKKTASNGIDLTQIVIDVNKLCNDIYVCDWV